MSVEVSAHDRLGDFVRDADYKSDGRVTAIFGPSGSGKTSVLNVIAGLLRPQRGRVVVDGTVLVDTKAGIFLPAYRRRIGYVFQESRLFPNLSVRGNLLYGRFFAARGDRYASVNEVIDLLELGRLLHRGVQALSGGERQRVAIGRALLASPRLLLFDEPLSSLDEKRKQEVMPFLERLRDQARVPMVYVSHIMAEIERLSGRVVSMSDGKVVAIEEGRLNKTRRGAPGGL
jgi:molybdate transport system ATP-binding protein